MPEKRNIGTIAAQLAGALWGVSGVPSKWIAQLAWPERIAKMGHDLYSAGAQRPVVRTVTP
jgi:hypothetical protein